MSDIKPVLNNRYHAWLEQPREQTRKVRSVDDSNLYDRERQTPSRQMSLHNYPSTSRQQESPHHQQIWYPSVSAVIEENKRREGAAARAYLDGRGIGAAAREAFGLGFAPEGHHRIAPALESIKAEEPRRE